MNKEELRKKLTDEQYKVTCEAATEPAFHNAFCRTTTVNPAFTSM